jgi:hypothetical protein
MSLPWHTTSSIWPARHFRGRPSSRRRCHRLVCLIRFRHLYHPRCDIIPVDRPLKHRQRRERYTFISVSQPINRSAELTLEKSHLMPTLQHVQETKIPILPHNDVLISIHDEGLVLRSAKLRCVRIGHGEGDRFAAGGVGNEICVPTN